MVPWDNYKSKAMVRQKMKAIYYFSCSVLRSPQFVYIFNLSRNLPGRHDGYQFYR